MSNQRDVADLEFEIPLIGDEGIDVKQRVLTVLQHGTWWAQAPAEQKQQYLQSPFRPISVFASIVKQDWPLGAQCSLSDSESGEDGCSSCFRSLYF
jgi:hypothetical protein